MGRRISNHEIDMCSGPLLTSILRFAIPVALLSLLQNSFNAVDTIILGRFAGSADMAAVGATSVLIRTLLTFFNGLSMGVNVTMARYRGAGEPEKVRETVHTAMLTAVLSGMIMLAVGVILARPMLIAMDTPGDILDKAVLYMQIYFLGVPGLLLYNYGAATLKAVGDTKRPLYFLLISGCVNVGLNLVFVVGLRMSVVGVAIATVASQYAALAALLWHMLHVDGVGRLERKRLRLVLPRLREIMRIGIPAGIQSAMFMFSSLLVQSAINSFGTVVVGANTAVGNIEMIPCVAIMAFNSACVTFVSQNYGAENWKRIEKVVRICVVLSAGSCLVLGMGSMLLGRPLLYLFTDDPEVVRYGMVKLRCVVSIYFVYALMDIASSAMRGLGHSAIPAAVSVVGICGLRIAWLYTVFAWYPTLEVLYLCFPVSWVVTGTAHYINYFRLKKKLFR